MFAPPGRMPLYTRFTHLLKPTILSAMDSRDIIRALHAAGWQHVATKGSHYQFKHPSRPGRVTVPHPKRDIPLGTLRSIEKQAGLTLRGSP
jgi:predicted RNA binding protein YcfA (HicA-like mRNA interferase family)